MNNRSIPYRITAIFGALLTLLYTPEFTLATDKTNFQFEPHSTSGDPRVAEQQNPIQDSSRIEVPTHYPVESVAETSIGTTSFAEPSDTTALPSYVSAPLQKPDLGDDLPLVSHHRDTLNEEFRRPPESAFASRPAPHPEGPDAETQTLAPLPSSR